MERASKEEIEKAIYQEETVAKLSKSGVINESFNEKEFKDKEKVLKDLSLFWTLSPLYQQKIVKNQPLIFEVIQSENILRYVK